MTGKVLLELEPPQIALYSLDQLILKGNSKMPFTGHHSSGNFHYSDRFLLILGGYLRDYLINTHYEIKHYEYRGNYLFS